MVRTLLASTDRQIHRKTRSIYNHATYCHLPNRPVSAATNSVNKQRAQGVDNARASLNLITALELLQQQPPVELRGARPPEILQWATEYWSVEPLKMSKSIAYSE